MVTEIQKRVIKAELINTAIGAVQFVGNGTMFPKDMAKKLGISEEDIIDEINRIVTDIVTPMFSEYRMLKDRPAELDDSEFRDWLVLNAQSAVKDIEWDEEGYSVESLALFMHSSVEKAVQDYRDFSAGDPSDD